MKNPKEFDIHTPKPNDDYYSYRPPKESYVIRTPEPGDDDYDDSVLSEVVRELLKEKPLICKWR